MPSTLVICGYIFISLCGVVAFAAFAYLVFGLIENARHDELCQKIRDEDEWDREHYERTVD